MENIRTVTEVDDLRRVYPVMAQLRPHLDLPMFLAAVHQQFAEGIYRLVVVEEGDVVLSVAGFRIQSMLVRGKVLYVDDLVTDSQARSRGCGKKLLNWLFQLAQDNKCDAMELDSGVQRFDAHRFYLRERMYIAGYHFVKLTESVR